MLKIVRESKQAKDGFCLQEIFSIVEKSEHKIKKKCNYCIRQHVLSADGLGRKWLLYKLRGIGLQCVLSGGSRLCRRRNTDLYPKG